jgi:RNA-binding protein YlmH
MNFLDRIKHYDQNTVTKTMFLTMTEQTQLKNQLRNKVDFVIYGGYDDFERGRAFINCDVEAITCIKMNYNKQYLTLTHQNILGTLLSLNIKREAVGDIIVDQDAFFIIDELSSFIVKELTMINNVPLTLTIVDGSNLVRTTNIEESKAFIDSLRLDLVVSKIANISRTKAAFLIENDFVMINHQVVNKITKLVKDDDILSIRKNGRFMIIDTSKTSKKGKIVLIYGKFV